VGTAIYQTGSRLNVDISLPQWAPDDLSCSGQIARLDVAPSGYAGWTFINGDARGGAKICACP
jgi:hypothetical protein